MVLIQISKNWKTGHWFHAKTTLKMHISCCNLQYFHHFPLEWLESPRRYIRPDRCFDEPLFWKGLMADRSTYTPQDCNETISRRRTSSPTRVDMLLLLMLVLHLRQHCQMPSGKEPAYTWIRISKITWHSVQKLQNLHYCSCREEKGTGSKKDLQLVDASLPECSGGCRVCTLERLGFVVLKGKHSTWVC